MVSIIQRALVYLNLLVRKSIQLPTPCCRLIINLYSQVTVTNHGLCTEKKKTLFVDHYSTTHVTLTNLQLLSYSLWLVEKSKLLPKGWEQGGKNKITTTSISLRTISKSRLCMPFELPAQIIVCLQVLSPYDELCERHQPQQAPPYEVNSEVYLLS